LEEALFSVNIDTKQLAPPGISGDLLSIQQKPNTSDAQTQAAMSDATVRVFDVRCICFRDTGFTRDVIAQTTFDDGTSFFAPPEGSGPGMFKSGDLTFEVVLNQNGEIAGFRSQVRASSIHAARSRFSAALTPMLDHLAYLANTPMIVSPPTVNDEKNLVWLFGYTSPYHTKTVNPGTSVAYAELAPVYSLYREAKNASSPFYRFLCYFKILEGIFSTLRRDLFGRARKLGVRLEKRSEVLPDDDELRILAPDLVNRSIKDYFDNVLRKQFRDAVAHYILDSGRIVSPSDPEAIDAFRDVILPAEICCRVVIEQHEHYLSELHRLTGGVTVRSPS